MKCEQPGCAPAGEIDRDGYCDRCGMAPSGPRPAAICREHTDRTIRAPGGNASVPTRSADTLDLFSRSPRWRDRRATDAARIRPRDRRDRRPERRRGEAVLQRVRRAGRPAARQGRAAREGFCREVRHAVLVHAEARAGRPRRRASTRWSGCLAHGGLGWIYLARDRNGSTTLGRAEGPAEHATTPSDGRRDRRAAVPRRGRAPEHRQDPSTSSSTTATATSSWSTSAARACGECSRRRRAANGGQPDPLPAEHAIAYILEILPAFGHLHEHGLLFCDFKPDNVIHTDGSLKLIDLGGVYRMDDTTSPIYGTPGFQAPEIARDRARRSRPTSITVGRTLAVLCTDFAGYQSTYQLALAGPGRRSAVHGARLALPLPRPRHRRDPDDRFQTAEEMADQLVGVLREIVAGTAGSRCPGASTRFTGELRSAADCGRLARPADAARRPRRSGARHPVATLATATPDRACSSARAGAGADDPRSSCRWPAPSSTTAVDDADRRARAVVEAETVGLAGVDWYRAWPPSPPACRSARAELDAVYRNAARRARAEARARRSPPSCRRRREPPRAWYDIVSRTDPGSRRRRSAWPAAGCARRPMPGRRRLDRVPDTSSAHVDARLPRPGSRRRTGRPATRPTCAAARIVEQPRLDAEQRRLRARRQILEAALTARAANGVEHATGGARPRSALTERDSGWRWRPRTARRPPRGRPGRAHRARRPGQPSPTEVAAVNVDPRPECPPCDEPALPTTTYCESAAPRLRGPRTGQLGPPRASSRGRRRCRRSRAVHAAQRGHRPVVNRRLRRCRRVRRRRVVGRGRLQPPPRRVRTCSAP